MSSPVLFDASVPVDDIRTGCHNDRMDSLTGSICHSAVVMSELWRGAWSAGEREYLIELEEVSPLLVPAAGNWLDSGRVLASMQKHRRLEPARLREMHFDVLIALTARDPGLRLVTSNWADFEMIRVIATLRWKFGRGVRKASSGLAAMHRAACAGELVSYLELTAPICQIFSSGAAYFRPTSRGRSKL
ncbi:MAG TPA: type II toxin-antitoxin system VapC family toxin [Acidobacteriaceae bacterium]|nr:type II toxin-antitoxin system VapC family toxin [Acidobacteriaceae bacterium]